VPVAASGASSAPSPPRPRAGGYFKTLPPGAPLPTGATCAKRIHRSAWEPRPQNKNENNKIPTYVRLPDNPDFNAVWQAKYKSRINGNFRGTTDEIIQWASCKWGINDDLTRARAVNESDWVQRTYGDYEPRSDGHCAPGWNVGDPCPTSFGLLQVKWYFQLGTYPRTKVSTAFNLDVTLAETRGCLDGLGWFGPQSRGKIWGCVGVWFSGQWGQGYDAYIARAQRNFSRKPWLSWRG